MRVLLVANPAAGGSDRKERDLVLEVLGRGGGGVAILEPSGPETFAPELRHSARSGDTIAVLGGDGSMNVVVNALEDRLDDVVLALVPAGTGNDLARTLGLPLDGPDAAEVAISGDTVAIDVGRAAGSGAERLFVNACMGGFPVQVDESVTEEMKERLGPAAFVAGALRALSGLATTTVRLEDVAVPDCVAVGVGNGRTCGGGVEVWPDADVSDGALDACAMPAEGLLDALRLAVRVRSGKHQGSDDVTCMRKPSVHIGADPSIEINVDGELVGLRTPATFTIERTIRMRVPA